MKLTLRISRTGILEKIFPEKTRIKVSVLDIPFHVVLVHFPTALYPVAMIFLFLALIFDKESFSNSYFYLMLIATLFTPLSHYTGILEWRKKFRGARTHIFINKIRYGIILNVVGGLCTTWYWLCPGILDHIGVYSIVFVILNISIIPIVTYLGHLGGRLVYGLPR